MSKQSIGIIGAGKLGTVLGNLLVQAGYPVYISGSGAVEKIALTIEILVPNAIPTTTQELAQKADIIILALPLSKYRTLNPEILADKLVIDAMNYWWETDGTAEVYSDESKSSSERVQEYLTQSRVIKAFNHVGYHDLADDVHAENRKAILLAGNNEPDLETTAQLIEDCGFTALSLGSLEKGRILEPGWELFGASVGIDKAKELISKSLEKLT